MRIYFLLLFISNLIFNSGCKTHMNEEIITLDIIAEKYVKLALNTGQYDPDFIDAYYGPEEWNKTKHTAAETDSIPFEELKWQATYLLMDLEALNVDTYDSIKVLRYRYLHNQIIAINTKLDMMAGDFLPFDVESRALYDAVTPHFDEAYYEGLLLDLEKLLPGTGSINKRYEEYSNSFIIPPQLLDTVFNTAITEAKRRTSLFIELPENERFKIEYVTDKPWSAYNWYKGNSFSIIQINTDLPIYIERAIDLACHEGYPGHHVYNMLLEKHLVDERNWTEFSVYLLFSPQSLIAEGSANYGIEMVFPNEERREYERNIIFPLAGIDPTKADQYYDILQVRNELSYAGNEAAMKYLNGQISREDAVDWIMKYNLYNYERALQRTFYFDRYRSYVINYNYGRDLIKNYIERNAGNNINKRWALFKSILSTPLTASMLE